MMRLIRLNGFDYYDSANCYGFDESGVLFVRKSETFELNFNPLQWHFRIFDGYNPSVYPFIVGFCRTIRVGFEVYDDSAKKHCFYDPSKLIEWLEKQFPKSTLLKYIQTPTKLLSRNTEDRVARVIKNWNQSIEEIVRDNRLKNFFLKYNTPYYMIQKDNRKIILTTNPILKDIEFYKIHDAPTAYQEIEMFLNSTLIKMNEPEQIKDNTVLLEKKGFDKKISFRHPIK